MTYVVLKDRSFYTETNIDAIDNELRYVGFVKVTNHETKKKIIITSDNLVFANEC